VGKLPTMAYIVKKTSGRFEIRESVQTDAGPRSRTLADFPALNETVLDLARSRATTPFDDSKIRAGARKLGTPVEEPQDQLARQLLRFMSRGHMPSPVHQKSLLRALQRS
jgi:hypothetical protein